MLGTEGRYLSVSKIAWRGVWGDRKRGKTGPGKALRLRLCIHSLFLVPRTKNFAAQTGNEWWSILGSN